MSKMRGEMVMLEMKVGVAGNQKIIGFLLEWIERKERFLARPVCFKVAAPSIPCCSKQHLICSSC